MLPISAVSPTSVGVGGSAGRMALLLNPSEYTGQKGTAVAGRVVMLTEQEIKCKASAANAAAPKQGKGGKGKKTPDSATLKLEIHLAGAESVNEVLYVEAWGEQAGHLKQKLAQGDLISIAGATHIPAGQNYSTSRLPYHLRVKGTVGVKVIVQKLDALPWPNVPVLHPLVPLRSLDRVKERQQICVAAQPGTVETDTAAGRVPVCNAVVQQEGTRVRCAFWREQAGMLAARGPGECVLLCQVLVEKKKEGSWEIGSSGFGLSARSAECGRLQDADRSSHPRLGTVRSRAKHPERAGGCHCAGPPAADEHCLQGLGAAGDGRQPREARNG